MGTRFTIRLDWATAVMRAPSVQAMRCAAMTTAGRWVRRTWAQVKEPRCLRSSSQKSGASMKEAITSRAAVRTKGLVALIRMNTAEVEQANTPRTSMRYRKSMGAEAARVGEAMANDPWASQMAGCPPRGGGLLCLPQ